ncbi:hypothetical protein GOBAR_AA19811 [Gossypium barbadense]|uniref:RNase H type-1 domain-containing protein n=1 Tax=Gossypium barbadense TaxID=3634 RepID=A0A2P5XBY7_GOSBA|nr:hypothetical protein GOBAR_AA19811 [Gossypium barbadense]
MIGRLRPFRSVLDNCELHDLGFERRWFTWERVVASLSGVISRQLDTMFHFESCWVSEPSCEYEIRGATARLKRLHQADPSDDILAEVTEVKWAFNMEANREELFWGQMERLNSVSSLVDDDGHTCPVMDAMFRVATRYFQGFFTSSKSENFDHLLEGIKVCITPLMNGFLLSDFTFQEIRSTIDVISHLKALGRDGFSVLFFQKYWHSIGTDATDYCLQDSAQWNHTLVSELLLVVKANRILSIPLSRSDDDDLVVWKCDPTSCYFIRSGYRYYHEGLGSTSPKLVSFIRSYLGGLLVLDAPGAVLVVLRTARWCPPPSPLVKANFNTTYIEGSHSYCSEVVVRDAQGQVLVSWNRIHGQVSSAFAAEALALLSVLDLARTLGYLELCSKGILCIGYSLPMFSRVKLGCSLARDAGISLHIGPFLGRGGSFSGDRHSS